MLKTIYQVVSKELLYHSKESNKPRILLLDPTTISAVKLGGTAIHSGLGIKPRVKLLGLSDKMKTSLRHKLSAVKMAIIEKLSMVSSDPFSKSMLGYLKFLCAPLQLNLLS